jgi:hypothetical protein
MKITLRNAERQKWMSGYGIINRELRPLCDSESDLSADVHLWVSPPYSFGDPPPIDQTKLNIGVTMGERDNLHSYGFPFVGRANMMDVVITTSQWQYQVMYKNGILVPIEVCNLGHNHDLWKAPVREVKSNRTSLVIDRGRDHGGAANELAKFFDEVNYMNCRTPKADGRPGTTAKIMNGRYTQPQMVKAYQTADVFLKWGREGWGFPILEAMSAGCLVVTNCVHLPFLKDKENCLCFRSIPELERILSRAAKNPYTAMKRAGQDTAAQLTWDETRTNIAAIIARWYELFQAGEVK